MKTTRTVQCNCNHDFQDRVYGAMRRLANLVTKSVKSNTQQVEYRCTVCKRTHTVNK